MKCLLNNVFVGAPGNLKMTERVAMLDFYLGNIAGITLFKHPLNLYFLIDFKTLNHNKMVELNICMDINVFTNRKMIKKKLVLY